MRTYRITIVIILAFSIHQTTPRTITDVLLARLGVAADGVSVPALEGLPGSFVTTGNLQKQTRDHGTHVH